MDLQLGRNMFVWKPGQSSNQPPSKMPRRRVPSEAEWQAQKERVVQLYIKDNMSRERVRETMKAWYGFEASDKMYKSRFKKWCLCKNITAKMVEEIDRQREAGNNPDHYVIREQVWEAGRVEKSIKRRSRSSRPRSNPHSPRFSFTPSSQPNTSTTPEALFLSIKTYFDVASPGFVWHKDTQDRLCMSKTGGTSGRFRLSRFHDRLLVAVNSFTPQSSRAELQQSAEVMKECMEEMRLILSEQDPFLLPNIFHLLVQIKKRLPPPSQHVAPQISHSGRPPLKLDQVLVDYGKELSIFVLGKAHPLTAVWAVLDRELKTSSCDSEMLSRALKSVLDEFEAQLGPNHAGSLIMRLHLFSSSQDPRWKEVVVKLLTVLEGGDGGRCRGSAMRFCRLRGTLENSELTQEHVNRVTKVICRLSRARMYSAADGQVDLPVEEGVTPDPEAELVHCLSSPPVVMDADYLP